MKRAHFRFYAELNDFLSKARRGAAFAHEFQGAPSVKDVVESLGVPHTEIDLILADGQSVEFSWILRDGARVSVYPVFESIDITPLTRVRPASLREVRFVLDVHLGRLARYLRMLGFDTRWRNDARDEELASVSAAEHRILLTRDSGLLKRRIVTHGYRVREIAPRASSPRSSAGSTCLVPSFRSGAASAATSSSRPSARRTSPTLCRPRSASGTTCFAAAPRAGACTGRARTIEGWSGSSHSRVRDASVRTRC